MPECSPPMMPARPSGFFSSATSSRSGSRSSVCSFSSVSFSPASREAHDDGAFEQSVVVGVQRLAQLEHHVVGDVDDRRNRTDAAALEALLHPGGRRRARHRFPRSCAKRSEGTPPASSTRTARSARACRPATRQSAALSSGGAGDRGDLARDAEHRQAVGAIRRDLERDQRVVELRARRGRRRPRARRRAARASPTASSSMPSSFAEHSMPCDSTPRMVAARDAKSAGKLARRRSRTAPACRRRRWARRRRCASRSAAPTSTVHTRRRSAFGCGSTVVDPADDDAARKAERRARTASTSSPAIVSSFAQARGIERGIDHRAQPAFGELHRSAPGRRLSARIWRRKRRSFSKNWRRSLTP